MFSRDVPNRLGFGGLRSWGLEHPWFGIFKKFEFRRLGLGDFKNWGSEHSRYLAFIFLRIFNSSNFVQKMPTNIAIPEMLHDPYSIHFNNNVVNEASSLKHIMHFNSFLAVASNSLAVYLIIYCSPTQIGTYKRYLLNIVVSFCWSLELIVWLVCKPLQQKVILKSYGNFSLVYNYLIF